MESATSEKNGARDTETSPVSPFFVQDGKRGSRDSPGPALGDLVTPEVLRQWGVRGAAAIAAGLVFGLTSDDPRIGATAAAAVLIGLIVHQSRRRSEVPRWRKPNMAQRRTEAQLRVMKRMGYRVLHARATPGGNGQIDHFIVGRRGAFAIDSEAWDKRLPLRNKLESLYHGRFSKNERIDEALEEARTAAELISTELGKDVRVRASLAIYGPGMPWDSHNLRGVDIIRGTKVRKWLRTGKSRLNEQEIEDIHRAAEKVLRPTE
ncbi:nuclease-related domain-containing protein [Nocardiopsis coralliicola]